MSLRRDGRRLSHDLQLRLALAQSHLVKVRRRIDDGLRSAHTSSRAPAEEVQTVEDLRIRVSVLCQSVVQPLHVANVVGELASELLDGERSIGAEILHCAFHASPRPVPDLPFGLPRPHEEDHFVLLMLIGQYQQALRLAEPREVIEVAILSVGMLDVVVAQREGRGWKHRRAVSDGALQIPACREPSSYLCGCIWPLV